MTLEEAKEIAALVVANKTRSHVHAARDLAEFVLGLQSVRPILKRDEHVLELSVGVADNLGHAASCIDAYFSTACLHEQHTECRLVCKFCPAKCSCPCHDGPVEHEG